MAKFDPNAWLEEQKSKANAVPLNVEPDSNIQSDVNQNVQQDQKFDPNAWISKQVSGVSSDRQSEYAERGFRNVDPGTKYANNGAIMLNPETDELVFVSDTYETADRAEIERIRDKGSMADPLEMQRLSSQLQGRKLYAAGLTAAESIPYIGGMIPGMRDVITRGYGAKELKDVSPFIGIDPNAPKSKELISQFSEENPLLSIGAKGAGLIGPYAGQTLLGKAGLAPKFFLPQEKQRSWLGNVLKTGARGGTEAGAEAATYEFLKQLYSDGADAGTAIQKAGEIGKGSAVLGLGLTSLLSAAGGPIANKIRDRQSSIAYDIQKQFGFSKETSQFLEKAFADNLTIDETIQGLQRAGNQGIIADASPAMAALLDLAATLTPKARARTMDVLESRATQAGKDTERLFSKTFGDPLDPNIEPVKQIMNRSKDARRKAYEKAYDQQVNYSSEEGLKIIDVLKRLDEADPELVRSVLKNKKLAEKFDTDGFTHSLEQTIAIPGANGEINYVYAPSVRGLDIIKRAIDSKAFGDGVDPQLATLYKNAARELRTSLGNLVGDYNTATKLGGDAIVNRQAYEAGLNVAKSKTWDIAGFASHSDEARAGLKEGIRSYLQNIIESAKIPAGKIDSGEIAQTVKALRETSSKDFNNKIDLILGKEEANVFRRELDKIKTRFETKGLVGMNSLTAIRQQGINWIESIENPALKEVVSDSLNNNIGVAVSKLKQKLLSSNFETREKMADEMINFFTNVKVGRRTPEKALEMLQRMKAGKKDPKDVAFIASTYLRNLIALPTTRYYSRETDLRK